MLDAGWMSGYRYSIILLSTLLILELFSWGGRLEYVCWFISWLDGGNSVVHKNVRHTSIHLLVGIWPLPSSGFTSGFVFLYCTLGVV
jgi:hypothetical protein